MRIGYLIPEFPGQTHNFFWRERNELIQLGVFPVLISTRKPPKSIISASWAEDAIRSTTYLGSVGLDRIGDLLNGLFHCSSAGFTKSLGFVLKAGKVTNKIRMFILLFMGISLVGLSRRQKWNHLHVHSAANGALVAFFAHLTGKITYSLMLHGSLIDYGEFQKEKWGYAEFGIVITEGLLAEMNTVLGESMPRRIKVAPMGVNVDHFKRSSEYVPFKGIGSLRIFSCGRLNPSKGHKELVGAILLLRKSGIDAKLRIAGEDETGGIGYRKELEKHVMDSGLEDHVVFLGAISEQQIIDQLEHAHVFALASVAEPLGIAIMEAMSMQLPVVVTGAGGVKELVDDGIEGILVTPNDPESVYSGIMNVANNPEMAIRLGDLGRLKIIEKFGSRRSASVLVALLEKK